MLQLVVKGLYAVYTILAAYAASKEFATMASDHKRNTSSI